MTVVNFLRRLTFCLLTDSHWCLTFQHGRSRRLLYRWVKWLSSWKTLSSKALIICLVWCTCFVQLNEGLYRYSWLLNESVEQCSLPPVHDHPWTRYFRYLSRTILSYQTQLCQSCLFNSYWSTCEVSRILKGSLALKSGIQFYPTASRLVSTG